MTTVLMHIARPCHIIQKGQIRAIDVFSPETISHFSDVKEVFLKFMGETHPECGGNKRASRDSKLNKSSQE